MAKYKNLFKEQARKDYGKFPDFEEMWSKAIKLSKQLYQFGKRKEYQKYSEVALTFMKDTYRFKEKGILNRVYSDTGRTIFEKFENTKVGIYEDRTSNFFKKYGDETIKYSYTNKNGEKVTEEKTLSEFFEDFKNKEISQEVMNDIISNFKLTNASYESETYRGRNYESSGSVEEDFGLY